MCLLCIEVAKGKMNIDEARRALPELVDTSNDKDNRHYLELQKSTDEELLRKAKQYKPE